MANERPLGLRTDDKKVEENWNKIKWDSKPDSIKDEEGMINKLKFGTLEEFKQLYEVSYSDGDSVVGFGIYKNSHHFMLRNLRKGTIEMVSAENSNIADTLLGLMNEIRKYQILGLENGTN